MKAPAFWNSPPGLASALLAPLSMIWTAVTRRRMARSGLDLGIPVICVGNLTAGGTGKTPIVMSLMERSSSHRIHVISRGYGGSLKGPLQVIETKHDADQVGDEPLLLSAFGPVWIASDRAAGGMAAKAAGAELILLDDGLQNPSLLKTLSIIVIDAQAGFGNGRVIPAGPLREPIKDGLKRADLAVLIGPANDRNIFLETTDLGLPVLEAALIPLETGMDWTDQRVLAFAGIGRPEKFYASLKEAGATIVSTRSFGDHAPYRADLVERLIAEAKSKNAQLVTTEKDAVRLPPKYRSEVLTFPVRLRFADESAAQKMIFDPVSARLSSAFHPERS